MGLGIDICQIKRLKDKVNDEAFINRILTSKEVEEYSLKNKNKLEYLAGRFSAKESVSKALGTGIGAVSFKDVEVLNDISGKPHVNLYENALKLWNKKFIGEPKLSISHDGDYVITVVTGEEKISLDENFKIPFPLKERNPQGHKGTFGKVGIIGGSKGMVGSIYLSSMACLKTGSGLVYTGVNEDIYEVMEIKCVENIIRLMDFSKTSSFEKFSEDLDAVGIGPGIGNNLSLEILKNFLMEYENPILIDADGLNTLSQDVSILKFHENTVLTPHEGEFSRLSKLSMEEIRKNRSKVALSFAKKHNINLVLKGKNTIVTDGKDLYINETGTSGLATAGSGDVLTGIITSLLGQGYKTFEASCLGVYIHGLCGNFLEKKLGNDGIIARDILNEIPFVMKVLREN